MPNKKCKKIIIADGNGGAAHTFELGGDVDSSDISWEHGDIAETPKLEDRARSMWEIWKPGRYENNNKYSDTVAYTAILSDSSLTNGDLVDANKTNVTGLCSFAVGNSNIVKGSSSGVIGTNNKLKATAAATNGLIIGSDCSSSAQMQNFIINGAHLAMSSISSGDSLCVLGRYNKIDNTTNSRLINNCNNDTLLVIGAGSSEENRKNILNLTTSSLLLDLPSIKIENVTQGLQLYSDTMHSNGLRTYVNPGQILIGNYDSNNNKFTEKTEILTDEIKTGKLKVENVEYIINDILNLPNFTTIKGIPESDLSEATYKGCFVNGYVTSVNTTNIFMFTKLSSDWTRYPIGVFEEAYSDSGEIAVGIDGLHWVRYGGNDSDSVQYCQIKNSNDSSNTPLGCAIAYNTAGDDSPTFNKYWRIISSTTRNGMPMVLINLNQSLSK